MAGKPKADVVPLFPSNQPMDLPDELPVGRKLTPAQPGVPTVNAVNLGPGPKLLFVLGPGRVGKTTLLRYIIETLLSDAERDGVPSSTVLATLDPKRTLHGYFEGVHVPPSQDAASVVSWLEKLLHFAMTHKTSAALDFAGDDGALVQMVSAMPDLVSVLEDAGIAPVALYVLSPRVEDLDQLATLEEAGFRPKATTLIRNEGAMADITKQREEAFAAIMRHSVYKAALARGAVELWMPRLRSADQVELRQIRFEQARAGTAPDGRRAVPMSAFDRSYVAHWLDAMKANFAALYAASWMPR